MDEETKEWLGLTKADLFTYISFALLIAGWFFKNIYFFSAFYLLSLGFAIIAALLGMPKKDNFSNVTNIAKKVSYLLMIVITIIIIVGRYFLHWLGVW